MRTRSVCPVTGGTASQTDPSSNKLKELATFDKHHFVDPALAARLLQVTSRKLLGGDQTDPPIPRDGTFLGALFESLIALNLRVYAQVAEADVRHLRTQRGEREIDFIVIGPDGGIVAIEFKLSATAHAEDIKHLNWLKDWIVDQLLDAVLVTTGTEAYRRNDGIAWSPPPCSAPAGTPGRDLHVLGALCRPHGCRDTPGSTTSPGCCVLPRTNGL